MKARERIQTLTPLAYSVEDAARLIGIGPATMWKWLADGRLPAIRINRRTLIKREDLEALLEQYRKGKPEVNLADLGML